jgi:hypothetical protein
MFKGFSDSSRNKEFHGFPNLNFQMNNERFGVSGALVDFDARTGLNSYTNLDLISSWKDTIRGIEFSQDTAVNQPRYISSDANFNNLPSIDFNESNARRLNSSIGFSKIGSILIVAKIGTVTSTNILLGNETSAQLQGMISMRRSTSAGISVQINYTNELMNSGVIDTSPHIIVISSNGIWVDGTQTVTGTFKGNMVYTQIGADANSTLRCFRGFLTRLIVYAGEGQEELISSNANTLYAIY